MIKLRNIEKTLLLVCIVLHSTTKTFSESVEGFAINISLKSFDIGTLHIALDKSALCQIGEVPVKSQFFYFKHEALGENLYHVAKTTSSPCSALHIHTGSLLRLEGTLQPDRRHFLALHVMLYHIQKFGSLEGAALVQEEPSIQKRGEGLYGTIQIDGYPLKVTPQTRMLVAPDGTTFIHSVHQHMLTIRAKVDISSPKKSLLSDELRPNTWVIYHAIDLKDGAVISTQLRFWPNQTSVAETRYLKKFATKISTDDVTKLPSSIQILNGNAIQILPNRSIQNWVSRIGMGLVPQYQKDLPDSDTTKIHFHFYVVRSFRTPFARGLVDINGVLPQIDETGGFTSYNNPEIFTRVIKEVITIPNGIVLIPDRMIASLHNEAQLAAVLSDAIASVLQKQAYFSRGHGGGAYFFLLWLRFNQQALRLGIRQMYLAGYDIREAPFAWAVAQGKPVNNPMIGPDHQNLIIPHRNPSIPWYAAYAFNYISHYYSDVDYSKLKRGEREYQQFLQELYKADPSLPRPQAAAQPAPQSSPAAPTASAPPAASPVAPSSATLATTQAH